MGVKYNRVMLKISGEAMAGSSNTGIDIETINQMTKRIKELIDLGVETMIVVGGGNFWRGRSSKLMERTTSDYIGMLGTVMNGLALKDSIEKLNIKTELLSSIEIQSVTNAYSRNLALDALENKKVVIFVAGLGHPYFSTDTTAALRAAELEADVILSAKQGVDGVYDKDPNIDQSAKKFDILSYEEVLKLGLEIQDLTAGSLCIESGIPTIVFGIDRLDNIIDIVKGEDIGTILKGD